MTYRGRVNKGVVVIEGELKPAEGTMVRVVPIDETEAGSESSVYDRLAQIAGKVKDLPPDLAHQHDR